MTKVINSVCIIILAIVMMVLCVWRATTNLPYWYPIDYIGVLAFGFTLLTAWIALFIKRDVTQLTNRYSLKMALPVVQKRLVKIRTELTKIISDGKIDLSKAKIALRTIVANCLSECKNLSQKTDSQFVGFLNTKDIIGLCREIKSGKPITEDVVLKLHSEVIELVTAVDIMIQDMNNEVSV